ncbi:hypothetical protein [Thiothrix sp.]|jgi:hypothetical protein|uniref:hypothetical protein n=1 Tax=Thiothrix sp. TaxID=1032 RepID=UPI002579AE10|nr:hypothetical protein [Thiothrix sp.]
MSIKKADPITEPASSSELNNTAFRFNSGNAGAVQKKIIRHLLAMHDGGLDSLPPLERIARAGTNAIRLVCKPSLNPLDYICRLRRLNGAECLLTIPVEAARISNHGNIPAYYHLPVNTRQAWREALQADIKRGVL